MQSHKHNYRPRRGPYDAERNSAPRGADLETRRQGRGGRNHRHRPKWRGSREIEQGIHERRAAGHAGAAPKRQSSA